MPDATPVVPTGTPPVNQGQFNQPLVVTSVAVIPQADINGAFTNTAMILEKAGDVYIVTFYDATTNTLYSGTDSAGDAILLDATVELDQLMSQVGVAGDLTSLTFTDANGQPLPNPATNTGLPQTLAQLPGGVPQPPQPGVLQPPVVVGQQPIPYAIPLPPGWVPGPGGPVPGPQVANGPAAVLLPINPNATPNQPQFGTIIVTQPAVVGLPLPAPSVIVLNRNFQPRPGLINIIRGAINPPPNQPRVQIGNSGILVRTR